MANNVINMTGGGGGTDISDTTAVASDVLSGKDFYLADGTKTSGSIPSQAGSTITPTESEQTAIAAGKFTTGDIKVGAISSSYVGSGIARQDSTQLSVSGATVTAPAGYYASDASKSVASGSATTPATTITANPTISVNSSTGVITATASASSNVTPTVSAGYVSSGTAGTITVSGSNTSQMTTKAAATITPGTTNQTIAAGTYLTGAQTIAGNANLTAGNIKNGTTIFGVTGTYTNDANATAGQIMSGKTAYVAGNKITGTMSDLDTIQWSSSTTPPSIGYSNGQYYKSLAIVLEGLEWA